MTAHFWPDPDSLRLAWLHNWNTNINEDLIAKYTLVPADMATFVLAEKMLTYFLAHGVWQRTVGESLTSLKETFFLAPSEGVIFPPTIPPQPAWPTTGVDLANIPTDIGGLVSRIAASMKANANYEDADGQMMKIVGAEIPPPSPSTTLPVLTGMPGNGGLPLIRVKMVPFNAWELWGDFATGSFVKVDTLLRARYQVVHPLPAPGVGAVWKFKAIFRMGNEQFGQWSAVLEFAVRG